MGWEALRESETRFYSRDVSYLDGKLYHRNSARIADDFSMVETLSALLCKREVAKPIALMIKTVANVDGIKALYSAYADYSRINVQIMVMPRRQIEPLQTLNCDIPDGFSHLQDYEKYLQTLGLNILILTNPNKDVIVVYAPGYKEAKTAIADLHLIQAGFPRMLPWLFADQPLTPTEVQLLLTAQHGYEEYVRVRDLLYEQNGIAKMVIHDSLAAFRSVAYNKQIKELQASLNQHRDTLCCLMREYQETLCSISEEEVRLHGLKYKLSQTDDNNAGLEEFFLQNKSVHLLDVNKYGNIHFRVKTYLTNFDPEMFSTSKNYILDILPHRIGFWDKSRQMKLLSAIFSEDPKIRVRMMADFIINQEGYISTGICKEEALCNDYLPNSHIEYFSCLGDNEMFINQCIQDGDFVMAVTQCVAAAGSQNILESPTMTRLLGDLFDDSDSKFIELPDGSNVTVKQAYEWLINQEGGNEQNTVSQ